MSGNMGICSPSKLNVFETNLSIWVHIAPQKSKKICCADPIYNSIWATICYTMPIKYTAQKNHSF